MCVEADLAAVLTTCDAHKANIKLLKHLCSSLPSGAVLLPLLCVQHRTGNVLEQLTKFLGNLGGIFCAAKVMSKSHLLKSLQKCLRDLLEQRLVIHTEVPAALVEQWKNSKTQLRRLIQLCSSFSEKDEEGAQARESAHARANSSEAAWKRFLLFFDGPFTGP